MPWDEQAHDHRLSVLHRERRETHVDLPATHADLEAPVLREALLRDVEPRNELQPLDQGGGDPLLAHHLLMQHAIDAQADAQLAFVGLDVDVRCRHLDRVLEDRSEQPRHRCGIGLIVRLERLAELEVVLAKLLAELLRQVGDLVRAPVSQVEDAEQVPLSHDGPADRTPQNPRDLVGGEDLRGVRHADQDVLAPVLEHDGSVAPRVRLGKEPDRLEVQRVLREVDQGQVELAGEPA
jgi:hypothetical protein